MKAFYTGLACLGMAGAAQAGGIDRSGQDVALIFEDGNYAEIGVARTWTSVKGNDLAQSPPGFPFPYDSGADYGDVAGDFDLLRFGLKYDVSDRVSVILTGGEDYGVDVRYANEPNSLLGGTFAEADSYTLSLIGRYHIDTNFSFHGGLRYQRADGSIGLSGLAYGPYSGYEVNLSSDDGYGYLIGGAYERPEIALRVALTYFSEIEHEFGTKETMDGASLGSSDKTKVKTPRAVNLDFQTGVAPSWMVFGQLRWVDHSQFTVEPEIFKEMTGGGLVSLDDSMTYTLGVGHRFTDSFAASLAYIYDEVDGDSLVSPLAPTHGSQAVRLGGKYTVGKVDISGGVRYTWLGDAKAQTAQVARADFSGNEAVSVGIKIGYRF
ncbi:outer membrane protein transport protein [Mangrovicoccus sp. HB161399]|uniref:outer membrane protein transport protein n=1 Tax=Mangrovicoccus sp. HB161399 TaxID=2720392 RepID=UPI001556FFBF|nr:outer membrane protein transport protein [Mangrovicoccus sp. HB161399]